MKAMALLIITLNSLNTSVSKRKHEENEKESFYFLNAYNKTNPIKNNPYFSTNESLASFTLAQLNTQPFKHGKYEDFENPNKYHTNNDVNNLPCSSKGEFDQCLNNIRNTDRLNNFQYLPQTTNQVNSIPNTISQFYSYVSDFNNETEASNFEKINKASQTHQICDEIILPACSSNVSTSGDLKTTIVVNTPSVRKKIENLGEYIFRYIIQNIPKSYISSHTRRLKIIKEVTNIFDKHKPNPVLYHTVFNHLYYKQSLHDLIMMYLSFDKNSIFNKKTCENFDYEFNAKILYSHNSTNLRAKMDFLVNEQKKIIFFSEIMELYKYTDDIPEIMFLFSLFDENSYKKITFVLHLMILFADKIKNIKENRVFILCMIFKAINIFYNGSFDIFLLPIYELKCHKELHDLSFFTWEFNAFKRRDLRVTRTSLNTCSASDIKYLKAVFLNYLYQHTIFIKYYDIGSNGIKLYQDLLEKITQPSECFACLLNEYLSLVQICIKDKL